MAVMSMPIVRALHRMKPYLTCNACLGEGYPTATWSADRSSFYLVEGTANKKDMTAMDFSSLLLLEISTTFFLASRVGALSWSGDLSSTDNGEGDGSKEGHGGGERHHDR